MPDVSDIDLLREYIDHNSQSAFAGLVQRHVNLVYSVAFRLTGNSQDAQDVAQAVFVILAQKAGSLRERTVLAGWLYETTRLAAFGLLRAKTRRVIREQEAYMQSTLNDSDSESVWQQLAPLLEEAMARLNKTDRTLLALRFYQDKSIAEAAALLGIQEWAAHKRAARAVEKLRGFFAKRGVTVSAVALVAAVSAHSVQAAPAALVPTITAVAMVKGATAGSSTTTLIKGALKIMAWTKAKTAITGAVILALVATTALVKHEIENRSHHATSFGKSSLVYAGYSTPQATLKTMLKAMIDGDPDAYLACCSPEEKARRERDWVGKSRETLSAKSKNELSAITAIEIFDEKTDSAGRMFLTVRLEGSGKTERLQFNKIDNDWKFAGSVGL